MTPAHATYLTNAGLRYATFTRRARAVLIDAAVLYAAFTIVVILADLASDLPGSGPLAWLALFCIFVLYEPVLVSLRGATIGHAAKDLVIVADETGRPPSFARALVRYLGKIPLGVFGFVTTVTSPRHQAAHDMLAHTTVQLAPTVDPDAEDFHLEREDGPVTLPSRARRAIAIVGYVAASYVVVGRIVQAMVSYDCLTQGECSEGARGLWRGIFTLWLVLSAEIALAGWRGMLPGARARPAASNNALSD